MSYNRDYMLRAIELAKKGVGAVNPNPMVGAVIVKDDKVLGEGYHTKYGMLHAEREALADSERRGEDVTGAEMYVTLEPCSHTGKQPPCTEAIIASGIKRVYIGSSDPNPLVAGNGIWQLRDAGVEVVTGCMTQECDELNPVFFHFIINKTPFVVYKYAMTMDGKTCTVDGNSRWISNEASRQVVQQMRNKYMAIMVGIGTVLKDNPSLKCHMEGGIDPIRIICDSDLRIPMDCEIVKTAGEVKTYVASLAEYEKKNRHKIRELAKLGVGTLLIPSGSDDEEKDGLEGRINLKKLMLQLGKMNIDSVLLEGGGELAWSMISGGYVHEVHTFVAPKMFGGKEAGTPLGGAGYSEVDDGPEFLLKSTELLGDDIHLTYIRK